MTDVLAVIFLGISAVEDIRKREIPVKLSVFFAVLGLGIQAWFGKMEAVHILAGATVGIALLGVSLLSREALGYGDGITVAVLGIYIGFAANVEVVLLAFFLSGVVSGILLLARKRSRKESIPFVPFLLAAHIMLFVNRMGEVIG